MEVSIPTDADGFLSQECPSCERQFKVALGKSNEEPIAYCPYCGYCGEGCWHTQAQVEYFQAVLANVAIAPELKKFERKIKGSSTDIVKIDVTADVPKPPPPPMETDDSLDILHFTCCNIVIKAKRCQRHFCITCGTEVDMVVSDSKKIFLSHKGVDKELVRDFKESLNLLGYDTWLDEDEMPAGTALDRGILQGMKDSCGVVFFITPSFKDDGFLESEVDYAIKEKREKGEKFAIVVLQFVDDDGGVGAIPQLLEKYVWKKPRTYLEALRHIIVALPVVSQGVDWRDEIAAVVNTPKTKSTTSELSEEAVSILQTAVAGNGRILHMVYLGGQRIQMGKEALELGQDTRKIALWKGGLEDLQRRRYIRDLGHKGEVFEVTREGYEVADELRSD